ncbi:MAG: hypothetical protein O3B73_10315, partial [bacterium]|nr:hypothetical protein [bacterium]
HREMNFKPRGVALDHANRVEGDLSLVYTPADADMQPNFGFVAGLWGERWDLSPDMRLHLSVNVQDTANAPWAIRLIDANGLEALGRLPEIKAVGNWQDLVLPLAMLEVPAGYDWRNSKLCEFEAAFGNKARIHLDAVRFEGGETVIGVTDKSLTQRRAEAHASRATRIETAFRKSMADESAPVSRVVGAFARMMLDEDLETANQLLVRELKESSDANVWSLLHTPLYCRFYFHFSNRCGKYPGRMTRETEALLLETLWDRTAVKNDIALARQSTWWLDGSENHDLNAKACNLVTSRIFMNEPEYRDRIYPDYGFGGSYHYGHAGYYGPDIDPASRHGGGRAHLADGRSYHASDHYDAWLAYMKTYFRERAERGFFLEYGSHTYTKHTLNMVDLAYQYSGDDELHALVGDFLTLFWAEWAQVSISGVRGGPKTRHHHAVYRTDTAGLINFHLGGAASADVWHYWNLINDYTLPPVVWKMALDREGMGCYTFKARGIGEEENVLPRPLGRERSLVVDTEARFLKSTFVTPDYTLGTQMDHPSAVHSHLSICGRWHGMTFAQTPESRIVPVCLPKGSNKKGQINPYELEAMFQTVHHEGTLIVQQSRRWYAVHPEWFPTNADYNQPIGIWIGNNWDRREEKAGWVFLQRGNAYAAVRPVLWDEAYERAQKVKTEGNQVYFNAPHDAPTVRLRTDGYSRSEDETLLLLEDSHAPVIIEAGRAADYPTLDAFKTAVLDNPLALYKTVVPGDHILVYTGCGATAKEITFNTGVPQIPTIGGAPVDYSYPKTFDSPYLTSNYKSGVIQIQYGEERLQLDFSPGESNT